MRHSNLIKTSYFGAGTERSYIFAGLRLKKKKISTVYPQAERIPEVNYLDDTSDFVLPDDFDGV